MYISFLRHVKIRIHYILYCECIVPLVCATASFLLSCTDCKAFLFWWGVDHTDTRPNPLFSPPYVMPTKCQLLPYETPVFIGYIVFKATPSANPPCACVCDTTLCPVTTVLFLLFSVPQTWIWCCNYNVVL